MFKKLLTIGSVFLLTACSTGGLSGGQDSSHGSSSDHGDSAASQALSESRLNGSPRHQEWVEVKNGDKTIHTWVVYPQTSEKVPVVLLVHENRGLNDWARGMADQVAEAGYIAVAPDLLSGFDATHDRTSDFGSEDEARTALMQLKPENVLSDMEAVAEWAKTIPASSGKLATAGFCWGGAQVFAFATESDEPDATLVFYGTSPEDAKAYENVSAPVYGFYAGNDQRVNATIPTAEQSMSSAGKPFEYETYEGAGHAFMRSGEDPSGDPANVKARREAWTRMKDILSKL